MKPATKWIAAIGGLLGANVVASVVLATTAARGASQVIPDYYESGVHYDTAIDHAVASRATGWRVHATMVGTSLVVTVRDASGALVDGARVRATGYQRAHASEPFALVLAGVDGAYRAPIVAPAGTCDVELVIERGREAYNQHLVLEVP